MRSSLLPFVLLSLSLSACAAPSPFSWAVHEQRSNIPEGWTLAGKHDASAVVPLRFALTQSNLEKLDEFLHDVSHPDSPNYGKHWSDEQVASMFAPSRETVDAVRNWLLESGVRSDRIKISPSGGWLEVKASVQEAESLLYTDYNVYEHESGVVQVACEKYHLPEHLVPHVDFVTPTVHFDARLSKRSDGGMHKGVGEPGNGNGPKTKGAQLGNLNALPLSLTTCDQFITPECLRALYGFKYSPVAASKNSYGIVEYSPQSYRQADLNLFAQAFDLTLNGVTPNVVFIDGNALSTLEGFDINGESDLDLEYAMNLVTSKQRVTLYQVGDLIEGASFNNFLDALDGTYCTFEGGNDPFQDATYPDPAPGGFKGPNACGTVKSPAHVISTSYGYNEADLTHFYEARQCAEYAKLGLKGITFLYSSGDNGVAGNRKLCLNPDGSQSTTGKIFNPTFPSTCPYITSVGATQIVSGKTVADHESACEVVIYSGGGFSNRFGIPSYQKTAVGNYLKFHHPPYPSSIWNATGTSRAYPDLSANGANYVVAIDGQFTLVYGTSASSPVVGAMLTMINDARIAKGKKPIGFINPTIYSSAFTAGFHDITNGTNPGCGTKGFSTSPGWDPVTGLGTPNFPKLLGLWLNLP